MGTLKTNKVTAYSGFAETLIFVSASLLSVTFIVGCASSGSHSSNRAPSSISSAMETQSQILPEIVLLAQDSKLNASAEKKAKLKALTSQLATMSHEVGKSTSGDPILKFVSRDFGKDLDAALTKMDKNDWDAARKSLTNITHYCVGCHTLQKSSTDKNLVNADYLKNMTHLQKADYYAAVMQFDDAVVNYEEALSDKKLLKDEKLWMESLQKMLAITVRVKASPSLTLELISRFTYPQKMKEAVFRWRTQAKAWRDEKTVQPDTLAHVRTLFAQAEDVESKYKSPSAFIHYLRISSMLHSYLNETKNSSNQEALYLSGMTASALAASHSAALGGRQPASINYWSFPEDYFKACITVNESSEWAKKCNDELHKLQK